MIGLFSLENTYEGKSGRRETDGINWFQFTLVSVAREERPATVLEKTSSRTIPCLLRVSPIFALPFVVCPANERTAVVGGDLLPKLVDD